MLPAESLRGLPGVVAGQDLARADAGDDRPVLAVLAQGLLDRFKVPATRVVSVGPHIVDGNDQRRQGLVNLQDDHLQEDGADSTGAGRTITPCVSAFLTASERRRCTSRCSCRRDPDQPERAASATELICG